MKLSLEWLNDFTPIDRPIKEVCDAMTLSGSKVEGFEVQGADIQNVVTGRILSMDPHPDADRLIVCQVDVGDRTIQIVTGAQNLSVGDCVPVALHGATLTGGLRISSGALRGQTSEGMLCSVQELGYTTDDFPEAAKDGIFILPQQTESGLDIKQVLGIDDIVIEFEITSNRVDCFSVEGLGREAAVTFGSPFTPRQPIVRSLSKKQSMDLASVEIEAPELCARYCARVVENVTIGPSPEWLRRRLRSAGVRPINNLVDITNYVMLELGQPMHAFDLMDLQDRRILVRRALENEVITTLDGIERNLHPSMLVIADGEKAVALAGVMGAENSEIAQTTQTVLLESATFNALGVRMAAKSAGLRTEASARFEKGLDSNQAERALNRACELIEQLGCGDVCQGVIDQWPVKPKSVSIRLDPEEINRFLGTTIPAKTMHQMLTGLGCIVEPDLDSSNTGNALIRIPSYRSDLTSMADLAEEIARLFDYNRIEPSLLSGKSTTLGGRTQTQKAIETVKDLMIGRGFFEACTYSFESGRQLDKLRLAPDHTLRTSVEILNPLGEDFARMRTTMMSSMLQIAAANSNRSVVRADMFEIAYTYHPKSLPLTQLPEETRHLAAFSYQEKTKDKSLVFLQMKGMVETLLTGLGLNVERMTVRRSQDKPWLHPGQSADLFLDGHLFGWLGTVHPDTAEAFEAPEGTVLLDIELDLLLDMSTFDRTFKPMPRYPSVDRDIALTCASEVLTADLRAAIRTHGGELLESVDLFDVYQGSQLGAGKKSVAFNLKFRSAERTLSDTDIQPAIQDVLAALEKLGAVRRE